jgi:hypothetical protein
VNTADFSDGPVSTALFEQGTGALTQHFCQRGMNNNARQNPALSSITELVTRPDSSLFKVKKIPRQSCILRSFLL